MSLANGEKLVQVRRKVLRRLYEPLLLLNALGQIRGERTKPYLDVDDIESSHRKARRLFVDGIAYICAYKKDPDYVTAAALERTPQGTIVWLAANSNVEERVLNFLREILEKLKHISEHDDTETRYQAGLQIKGNLSSTIISFNKPRIQIYYRMIVKTYVSPCLRVIRDILQKSSKLITPSSLGA